MATITFPNGVSVPALGQGTWNVGDNPRKRSEEIATLQAGIDLGLTLIDTAEMCGEGAAETLVGEATAGRRDGLFIVSKVYPHNASRDGVQAACARSLQRLGTDWIDLYLLHWPGSHPLEETIAGFEMLKAEGKIGQWGVSNFDTAGMEQLVNLAGGGACATNQVLYNLNNRGVEFDLLPWMGEREMPLMAYSPLDQGGIDNAALTTVAALHGVTTAEIALAFVLSRPGVIAIPKASTVAHVTANAKARDITLTAEDIAALNRAFPPPKRKVPLGVY